MVQPSELKQENHAAAKKPYYAAVVLFRFKVCNGHCP